MKSVLKPTTSFVHVHMYITCVSIWQHMCSCGFIMMSDKRSDLNLSSTTTSLRLLSDNMYTRSVIADGLLTSTRRSAACKMPEGSRCENASASSNCWKDNVSAIAAQICSKTTHTQVLTHIVVMVVTQPLVAVSGGSYGNKPLADG